MSGRSAAEDRPPIPADLRRRVLVEAGHRCAIPTCRHIDVEVHHIVPWSIRPKHEYENLLALCPNCHRRADRGNIDRKSLRLYKANLRFIHDKFSQMGFDVLLEAYNSEPGQPVLWPSSMLILIKRLLEAGYIECHSQGNHATVSGLPISPDHLYITEKGKEFVEDIGIKEM